MTIGIPSHLRALSLAVAAALAAGCGSEEELTGDNICGFPDPDCESCATAGNCCLSSTNCEVGAICNLPGESLYDASKAEAVCIKLLCDSDSDCTAPETCSLEKICRTPVCQTDGNCSTGQICVSGACVNPPSVTDAASCQITSRDGTLAQGSTMDLSALAYDASGTALPGVSFTWASSDDAVVSVSGSTATGGSTSGTAMVSAMAGSVSCGGTISVVNHAALAAGSVRVTVVTDGTGAPLADATVQIDGAMSQTAMTDAAGEATFAGVSSNPTAVSVWATGYQIVTVAQPGSSDVFIPLPAEPDETRAGGFYGKLDISSTPSANLALGFAAPALPLNLLDFGLDALIGDFIPTEISISALEIDFTGANAIDLPGGLMVALENSRFTADATRCQGVSVGSGELGCFLARAPEGKTAGWALGGQLKLNDVVEIFSQVSDTLGVGSVEDLPIGDLLVAVLPLLRSFNHALEASLDITYSAKVDGGADYSKYERQDMAVSQAQSVLSVVNVPDLPGASSDCANAAVLLGAAVLEGRGLVPLGVSGGADSLDANDTPDCKIGGVSNAFGEGTTATQDGQIPIALAPLHSGAEGSETFFLLVAADSDKLLSDNGFEATAIVDRTPNGVSGTHTISGPYLDVPAGTIDGAAQTITLGSAVSGATLNRYEMQGGGQTWLVYAPSSVTSVTLPNVTGGTTVTSSVTEAYMLSMGMEGQFSEVFQLGSGKTLDRLVDTVSKFSVVQCTSAALASCRLQ